MSFTVITGNDTIRKLLDEVLDRSKNGELLGLAIVAVDKENKIFVDACQVEGGNFFTLLGGINNLAYAVNQHINEEMN